MNPLKSIRRLVLTGLLAFMLLLNTACGSPDSPQASGQGMNSTERRGFETELYDATQPNTGGMNQHYDDVRDGSPALKAKSRALVDNAKRNVNKEGESLREVPRVLGGKVEEVKDNIVDRAERQKDELAAGTKRGMKNLKGNLDKASKEVPEIVKEATSGAQENVRRSADTVKDTADVLRQNVERTTEIDRPLVR
jgi:gas vesicle protein